MTDMTTRIPIRTVSESNQREHWAQRAKRTKRQRQDVFTTLRAHHWPAPPLPIIIALTRIAPRQLDQDNLAGALKGVQDAVADWLAGGYGTGQDRQPGLRWRYAQHRGSPREYAVEISIINEQAEGKDF